MSKYYYNGVLLPEIPADVLASYPYAWIRNNTTSGYYDLVLSDKPFYYHSTPGIFEANNATGKPWYRVAITGADSATAWENNTSANVYTWWGLDSARTVMWSNHNIPNGSETATDIYFSASKALPEDYSISMLSSTEAETGILGGTAIVDDRTDMSGNIVVDGITMTNGSLTLAFAVPADDFYLVRMYFTHYDTREFRYTLNGKIYRVSVVGTSYNKAESIDFQMYLTKGANIVVFTGGSTTYAPMFDRFDLYKFRYDGEQDIKYSINASTLTAIADAIRAKKEITTELTPAQMVTEIEEIEVGGGSTDVLPSAEESIFGAEQGGDEYGISTFVVSGTTSGNTLGYEFVATKAFSIIGIRNKLQASQYGYTTSLCLWNANGEAVRTISLQTEQTDDWMCVYFDSPVNVSAGEKYTVSAYCSGVSHMAKSLTFNPKLTNIRTVWGKGNSYPTNEQFESTTMVDIIIGDIPVELPNDYQVKRITMDDIAEEVQRITGTEDKMSTAQIITALNEIEDLEDYEEVTF